MQKYFNIFLEFNHNVFKNKIETTIQNKKKGYVCVVDANVLTIAQKDLTYRSIINDALINTCDGSSIAVMAGWIHKTKFQALNGPEIFQFYIERPYRQVLLGSTDAVLENIKQKLQSKGINTTHLYSLPLPFKAVEEFNYIEISKHLNTLDPEIIWVSLGAPKQEQFMGKMLPYINCGVMFGIGAAFNFYTGELGISKFRIGRLRFIWLNRLFQEPKKLSKRLFFYIINIPGLYWNEKRRYSK